MKSVIDSIDATWTTELSLVVLVISEAELLGSGRGADRAILQVPLAQMEHKSAAFFNGVSTQKNGPQTACCGNRQKFQTDARQPIVSWGLWLLPLLLRVL